MSAHDEDVVYTVNGFGYTQEMLDAMEKHGIETPVQKKERIERDINAAIEKAKQVHNELLSSLDDQLYYQAPVNKYHHFDPNLVTTGSPRSAALIRFLEREDHKVFREYINYPERIPLNFEDNETAAYHLRQVRDAYIKELSLTASRSPNRQFLNPTEAAEAFARSRLGATLIEYEGFDARTLVVYDYNKKIYTYNPQMVAQWLTILTGATTQASLKSFILTLESMDDRLTIYHPLPRWKIAVGNGIYNVATQRIMLHTPIYTVTSRIETNFIPFAKEPNFSSGITFDKLISDLANNKPDREILIRQMVKSIVLGYSPTPAIFTIVGPGGDGKSLFMTLLSKVLGSSNVGALTFADMNDESKTVEVSQKRVILGMDNSAGTIIKNTAFLKSAASNEVIRFFRKFMPSIALRVSGIVVQLCNEMPKFAENGGAIRRRLILILAENSHYENNTEVRGLREQVENRLWHEHILYEVLTNLNKFPYFSDYNAVDSAAMNLALDADDPIGTFFDDLFQLGALANSTTVLPRSIVYAAYTDWMAQNYPGSRVHSSRTFNSRAETILREYGIAPDQGGRTPVRLSTIAKTARADFSAMFGHMSTGPAVSAVLENGSPTRSWFRFMDVDMKPKRKGSREYKKNNVIEYFNLDDDLEADLTRNPLGYIDVFEEFNIPFDIESNTDTQEKLIDEINSLATRDVLIDTFNEVQEREEEDSKQAITFDFESMSDQDYYNMTDQSLIAHVNDLPSINTLSNFRKGRIINATPDMLIVARRRSKQELTNVLTWLKLIEQMSCGDERLGLAYAAAVDRMIQQFEKYAASHLDSDLVAQIELVKDASNEEKLIVLDDALSGLLEGAE